MQIDVFDSISLNAFAVAEPAYVTINMKQEIRHE